MSTPSDDITYFRVCFAGDDLKFGVPTAMARNIVESTRKAINKKVSLETAIANGENAIADAFRKGLHRNTKASKKLAPFIISCCLLANEALENPDAHGFILEFSHSMFPSWSTDATALVADGAAGQDLKMYAHYKAVAGKAEIDAVLASRPAQAVG